MKSYREVCEELDRVLLEVMVSMEELSSVRANYNYTVSEGYFYMAQARHAMGGPSTVSPLQYDASGMTSLVHVTPTVDAESYDQVMKLVAPEKEWDMQFQVDRIDPSKPIKNSDSKETVAQQSGESQLRKRNVGKTSSSIEDVPVTKDSKTERQPEQNTHQEKQSTLKDPIKWFGILVPPYLRRSQGHFCQAILLSAELASIQLRLETMRRRYRELLTRKKELIEPVEQVSA